MKLNLTNTNRQKVLIIFTLAVAFGFSATAAFASLTLTSSSVASDGSLTLSGAADSTWDLGSGSTLSLQTSNNGPITTGTGPLTVGGNLGFGSTTHAGIKLNNLTTTQRNALTSPSSGMTIYNTTAGEVQIYNGSTWGSVGGLTVGTTTITSGSTGRVLYDNAGALGEMTTTGTGTILALATSPAFTTPDLGTPSAAVLTNASGTAASLTAGHVTSATFTTALTINTGTLTLTANSGNTSVLTIGAGAV